MLEWITSIPDYKNYFNDDHRAIIDMIGIEKYFTLFQYFGKTSIYFSRSIVNSDQQIIIDLIGEKDYLKIANHFDQGLIYFSGNSINVLKKTWVRLHRNINYSDAARMLGVSVKTIYNWRQEDIADRQAG